jgi:hypothetical protein
MAKSLDQLIEYLLGEIAISGSKGRECPTNQLRLPTFMFIVVAVLYPTFLLRY